MATHTARRLTGTLYWIVPFLVLLVGMAYEFQAVLARCEGRFVYSLDDPYIHLALAERIAAGSYGINPGEPAAPSSSVIWPFLLVPFASTPFFEYIPLVFNIICAVISVWVYTELGRVIFSPPASEPARSTPFTSSLPVFLLAVLLIPTTNLIGLAFTGMEHSLQVLLTAVIVYGLARLLLVDRRVPWWLTAAVIAAPLVRFECLAVSAAALAVMLLRRQFRAVGAAAAGLAAGLGGFALFLHGLGLGWLPTSVAAKSSFFAPGANLGFGYGSVQSGLLNLARAAVDRNLYAHQAGTMRWMMLALALAAVFSAVKALRQGRGTTPVQPSGEQAGPGVDLLLALFALAVLALHLIFGQFGWWDRYEVYAFTAGALTLLLLARGALRRSFRAAPAAGAAALVLASLWAGAPYYINFVRTPEASANIYEQQYQMHRFVVDLYRGPVAVNDLGWVAYRNPYYVLDLWGLASKEALEQRTRAQDTQWMDQMARERGVRLVMVYDTWFTRRPTGWQAVGRLYLGQPQASAGGNVVTFYALDNQTAEQVRGLLIQFRPTLPRGVRLVIS